MAARSLEAQIAETRRIEPGLFWMRLRAPDIGASLKPGQFITVLQADRLDPYLPTPLHPTHIASDELGCLLRLDERLACLQELKDGQVLQTVGPLGRPFALERTTRNLLLVGEGFSALLLLPLAEEALRRRIEVSFYSWDPFARSNLIPPGLLSSAAEYRSALGVEGLRAGLAEMFPWAEQVCAAGSMGLYEVLRQQIERARLLYSRGYCQVVIRDRLMCAVGMCGQCQTKLKRRTVQVCTDGPVFDLKDVV